MDRTDATTTGVPAYLEPYRHALAHHGPSFEATLWKSRRTQRARFRVLTRMIDLRGLTVLDAGCGLADLAEYLRDRRIEVQAYLGVDAFPDVIERARARGFPQARFERCDFAGDAHSFAALARGSHADVALFSGSLNTFEQAAAIDVLGRAFDAVRVGVVFNFLSAASPVPIPVPADPAKRFDPAAMLAWALGRTPLVRMRSDYLGGRDATIAMIHRGSRADRFR